MATYLHDIASNAYLGNSGLATIPPLLRTAGINGTWTDMIQGDGLCTVICTATVIDGTVGVTVQQGTDAANVSSNITLINSTGNFSAVTSSFGNGTIILGTFQRDNRYLRANTTFTGNATYGVYFVEQKKFLAQ